MPEFTVSEISKALKKTVEDNFSLVRVRGEISECKYHSSGHVYISLKDEGACLASVCWKGQVAKLAVRPEVGMDVVCTGRLTTFAGQSKYQLVIEGMSLAGIGALLKMLEERKNRLTAEGLFDPSRKRSLPFLPKVIGVITSPTGAVIRDILHRLSDRFPRDVVLWPVAVQGEAAAKQIVSAIRGFNFLSEKSHEKSPDVIIIARGGGSIEDLMAFNDEGLVRAVAASKIPIIAAVGHETDTTLIDFAADLRAPTPTAAAEMAVPVRELLRRQVMENGVRLHSSLHRAFSLRRERLTLMSRALGDPLRAIEPLMQKLDDRAARLAYIWGNYFNRHSRRLGEASSLLRHPRDILKLAEQRLEHFMHRANASWREIQLKATHKFEHLASGLHHLSPKTILGRGYTLVTNSKGHLIKSESQLTHGEQVSIEFYDGIREAKIAEK